ncbi:MAG: hypothetical protein ACE5DW_01080 [Thermodesulfobacteriota bacterium]
MARLNLYVLFHCNLAFSLIAREEFPVVIKNCYWPLLRMAEEGIPIAIEMPAWTLREVQSIDPAFTRGLKELLRSGRMSFIGSGYAQSIMPLIPAGVNRWNLELGNKYYEEILGFSPSVALVNEQTFSAGLVGLYKEAGYDALIMDWNNCSRHNEYAPEIMYSPQRAAGRLPGESMGLLWSNSIAFQKFGRCVSGELSTREYREYLLSHYNKEQERAFVAYSNDAEVFDYRPGLGRMPRGDFKRIRELLKGLIMEKRFALLRPEEILRQFKGSSDAPPIRLESTETPIVCKKQERYNPLRWSVTGRDSAHLNARCLGVYKKLLALEAGGALRGRGELCEMLCEVWGSDFRTNTTDDKLAYLNERLGWLSFETRSLISKAGLLERGKNLTLEGSMDLARSESIVQEGALRATGTTGGVAFSLPVKGARALAGRSKVRVYEDARRLRISTGRVEIEFLKDRGLALASVLFPHVSARPLLGTLGHGYFDSIELGADFFSGHLIHTDRAGTKTTDLVPVVPTVIEDEAGVRISAVIDTSIGRLVKEYQIPRGGDEFTLSYRLTARGLAASSLRLGIFTLMPGAFDKKDLWFETINGGTGPERFSLSGRSLSHAKPVSPAISGTSCLGATEGWVSFGDRKKTLCISSERNIVHTVPMINYSEPGNEFFLRLYHSAGEVDDTAYWVWRGINEVRFKVMAEKVM